MDLQNRLDVALEEDEYQRLLERKPLQIPTGNRLVVVLPPQEEGDE